MIGSDGVNDGFIPASDRLEATCPAQDEANLVGLASLTSTALDALAQLHLPQYRAKVADPRPERPGQNPDLGQPQGSG